MVSTKNNYGWHPQCPTTNPPNGERVVLAQGDGGRLTRKLIRERILKSLGAAGLHSLDDSAHLPTLDGAIAMTTDSFVVSPLFFPGGDIGSVAVYGTVNDLAVSGAKPLYLTLSLILEEDFPLNILDSVIQSVATAALESNVRIVTGDTKVVPRGAADGLFINTAGVGQVLEPAPIGPVALSEGDELIISGPVGCHGAAVLCAREQLGLEPSPRSDSASLALPANQLQQQLGKRIRAMRDATRGGITSVLHEWAEASQLTLTVFENKIPVTTNVRGACELLGLEPLHLANEGTMLIAVESGSSQEVIRVLQSFPVTSNATRVGVVREKQTTPVIIRRSLGVEQPLSEPVGAPLPRIC